MKILLLAGEESGLLYANRLRELLEGHEIRGYADYGFQTADLAVMGFWPVLKKISYFLGVKKTMERAIDTWRPDAVCTIDYPGLNLKLDAYAKAKGIRTVHVVCPQVWAWKKGRIPKIEAALDRLCCFFPFEPALFRPGFAEFVGHPLVGAFAPRGGRSFERNLVALLPGSRIGEVERNLPAMLAALARLPGVSLRLAGPVTQPDYLSELKSRAAELGVADRLAVVGALKPGSRELIDEYRRADVFVLPSRHEPFGIVVLEAWAAGLPVVASDVGGLGRLCAAHPGAALTFECGSQGALEAALSAVLSDGKAHEKLSAAGKEAAKSYDWRELARKLVGFYAEI